MEWSSSSLSTSQGSDYISVEAERYILNELHSDLVNNMSSMDVSYLMMTEQLLLPREYKKFSRMMDITNKRRNKFLLGCLAQRQQGFLTKFQKILVSTSLKHTAEFIARKMADAASNSSAYDPEEKWKDERRKLEKELVEAKRRIKLLERENNNFIQCIARFQLDISKCCMPRGHTQALHPESQQSSDTDPHDNVRDDSSSESSIASDGTIEPSGEEDSLVTLVESSLTMKNLSTQTSFTNFQPLYQELPVTNPSLKSFSVQVSNPNSPHYSSLMSLSGISDRSTTETQSNLSSMMSLSSSEKSIAEAEKMKTSNTPTVAASSQLDPASKYSIKENAALGIDTSCVGTQTDSLDEPKLKIATSNSTDQATQTDLVDKPRSPLRSSFKGSLTKVAEITASSISASSGNNPGSQSFSVSGEDPKFAALMERRRNQIDDAT